MVKTGILIASEHDGYRGGRSRLHHENGDSVEQAKAHESTADQEIFDHRDLSTARDKSLRSIGAAPDIGASSSSVSNFSPACIVGLPLLLKARSADGSLIRR